MNIFIDHVGDGHKYYRMAITSTLYNECLRRRCLTKKGNVAQVEFYNNRYYPLYVIDVSNQSDSITGQVTDITVKINFNSNITKPLKVYAVVVSDRIVETESDGSKFRVLQ